MKKTVFSHSWKAGLQIALLLVIALYNFMPGVTTVVHAAPSNDSIAGAIAIGSLPFSMTEDTTTALEPGDGPQTNPVCDGALYQRGKRNVWFTFTAPTTANMSFDTFGTNYDTYVAVWTGPDINNLSLVGCNDDTAAGYQSQLVIKLTGGVLYYIEASQYAGLVGGAPAVNTNGGTLQFRAIAGGGADTVGVFRPMNGLLYLLNSFNSGFADVAINYGIPGDYPVVGDWDGNGTATIGVYRNGQFLLRNSNTLGFADMAFAFGQPGDQPIAGDWNNDGVDTIGVFRPSTAQFLLRNTNDAGPADASFYLGNPGDVGIAGDWNNDGFDTTGVFRPINGIIFLKNTNVTGFAEIALNYGIPGDKPVTGDWNNDGIDTIGVYRNGQFLLRNSNDVGFADISLYLGNPGDMPIAGNWDGIP